MSAHDALVCTLRLLFDGKDHGDIAKAVGEALDHSEDFWWCYGDRLSLARLVVIDMETELSNLQEWAEEKFVGTRADMVQAARNIEHQDSGIDVCPWVDDELNRLRDQGLLLELGEADAQSI